MYTAIKEKFILINQRQLAKEVGMTYEALNRIINGKQTTKKATAYCIVKSIHPEAEIDEYFVEKGE